MSMNSRFGQLVLATSLAGLLTGCFSKEETNTQETTQQSERTLMQALSTPAPKAKQMPHTEEWHGITLSDPYNWLRDKGYPEIDDEPVLEYLKQENAYFDSFIKPHEQFVETLFEEMKGRVDETEESVPYQKNGYVYRWYYKEGADYRTYVRKKLGSDVEEEVLDEQALAEGFKYHVLSDWEVSPNNEMVAYTVDTAGDERYVVRVKNISTQKMLDVEIPDSDGSIAFVDNQTVVYGRLNPNRWRTDDIVAFDLNTRKETILLSEPNDEFFLSFEMTLDGKFINFGVSKYGTQEIRTVSTADIYAKPMLFASRDKAFSYSVAHAHGKFYVRANDTHVNFRLAVVDDKDVSHENWETIIEGSDDNYLKGIQAFEKFIMLRKSSNAFEQLIVRDYEGNQHQVKFPEQMISLRDGGNYDFTQSHIRLDYESFMTPDTVFDYDVENRKLTTRKVTKIPSGYDKGQYEAKRVMVPTRDGVEVPVSLMYKKGLKLDGSNPVHMIGYGAYGFGYPTTFSTTRLSMIDRGVVHALAHVRGGDDMGFQWYLDGKLKKRNNTWNDFVDAGRYLIEQGYTSAKNISISGRSAGGELMGAAVLQAPELWSGVILGVPFVDVLNTILDASLPLTPPEWEEWGNPIKSKEYFEFIRSYSPYDNIEKRDYPPMMVTGGLNDPRVTYWEPAKWTAKMRDMKTDNNLLVMRMNMGAGHFANSGRYGRLKDYAQEYAFVLLSHGIDK